MGQAKRRKAEIDALKATGTKKPMAPFMIRGTINPDGTVSFPIDGLDSRQAAFVQSCQQTINTQQVPEMVKNGTLPTQADSLAFVMYHNPNDFAGSLLVGINGDPDDAWEDHYQYFLDSIKPKTRYPQIGDSFTREDIVRMGTEQAGVMFELLNDGGVWPWPNAHAVLEKRGDRMVVIDTI